MSRILGATSLAGGVHRRVDVAIVGSGAGGATLAARLASQGLEVALLEAGGAHTSADWGASDERVSYPMLYQDRGSRTTDDAAITVLQGRSLGGGTTVNWTTCFRTPDRVLARWAERHGATSWTSEALRPHFEAVEARLNITPWEEGLANPNNASLRDGARRLGIEATGLRRNVKGCRNSGSCGLGCPHDAKMAMHLTMIPDAVTSGATVYTDVAVDRVVMEGRRATGIRGRVLHRGSERTTGAEVAIDADVVAVCGGAINSPALLLRSGLGADLPEIGRRTFLHPVVAVTAEFEAPVHAWYGAPQSIASHASIDRGPNRVGYFLEAAPLHPMLAAIALGMGGPEQAAAMSRLRHTTTTIGLSMDGWVEGDEGGTVTVDGAGRARLAYPVGPLLAEAMHAAMRDLVSIQLAAGALRVGTLHVDPVVVTDVQGLGALDAAAYGAHEHGIFSAHQMGGCRIGTGPGDGVVDDSLRVFGVENLFVVDGSVFPTSLGVNPSETIYAMAHRAAAGIAAEAG